MTTTLSALYGVVPRDQETVVSQLARGIFGGGPLYYFIEAISMIILVLAANTAFADFPRLAFFMARDGYLPRQFGNRGDRLVFSNGTLILAVTSASLIAIFRGSTHALIPLYAVGVFTSFTLSQTGMVKHHMKEREPSWRNSAIINAVGAVATLLVLLIVAVTKFSSGAWVPKIQNFTSPTTCERDVTVASDIVKFDGCYDSNITLRFDPNDQDYTFKGKSARNYEYNCKAK